MFEKVKARCDSFLEMGVPGFDLLVLQNGKEILRYMNGYSDLENKVPIKGDERYHIYSCSKVITCTAAMQLWEKGLFSLEDKLSDYLPEYAEMTVKTEDGVRKAKTPIYIHNLFSMTAGFNYNLQAPALVRLREETNGRCPTREFARALAEEPLDFDPGERYQYSLCHDVLAAFVEVVSGQNFEEYVQQHIFKPLGMTRSTYLPTEEDLQEIAPRYIYREATQTVELTPRSNHYRIGTEHASGGAGCVSTVDDYMKFLEALRAGETILKRDTIALMATDRLTERQRADYDFPHTYGYGLGLRTPKQGAAGTDFGWSGAAGSYLAVDIPHGLSIFHVQHMLLAPNRDLRPKIVEHILADLEEAEKREHIIATP